MPAAEQFSQLLADAYGNPSRAGRCLLVGEVAQAHDGSLGMAHAYIDAIADAGADAVKFQTHIAAAESTIHEPWRVRFSRQDETRFDYWKRMEFTEAQWHGLKQHADERGLAFLSSPFSIEAVELLERVGVAAWKIASGEVGNPVLLDAVLSTGRPVMLSSGMSDLKELDFAVDRIRSAGRAFSVMQCTSAYPCPPERIGLNLLDEFRRRYECPVGLSDHSGTIYPSLAAATLGASVVEVHVTFHRQMFGPDVPASVTLEELASLARGLRFIDAMMGNPVNKEVLADDAVALRAMFTKSVVARRNLTAGHLLTENDLALRKPGTGIPADCLNAVIGRKLVRDLKSGSLISEEDLA